MALSIIVNFLSFLKLANAIPSFKKDFKNSKGNYRPISILKKISKVNEIILFKQIGIILRIMTDRNNVFFQSFNAVLEKVMIHSNVFLR